MPVTSAIPPYLDWVIPFLRALRKSRDEKANWAWDAIRKLVKDGALPSVFLPAIHQMVEMSFAPAHQRDKRPLGAQEQRLASVKMTVAKLKELIQLRRQLARKSAELNRQLLIGRLPAEVVDHIRRDAGLPEKPMSPQDIDLLREQPGNDRACTDILEENELPVWERLGSRRLLRVTHKFLLVFLHRYFTLRTGQPHPDEVAYLLNAALSMSAAGVLRTNKPGLKTWKLVGLKGRRRGRLAADPQDPLLNASWIAALVSRFPSEHPDASAVVDQWAKREAAKGPWQKRDAKKYDFHFDRKFDDEIAALMASP